MNEINLKSWSNKDVKKYYNNIPIEIFKNYCKEGGFINCEDLNAIYKKIKNKKSLLDVGCGYGRNIKGLLDIGFKGKITGVELSERFYDLASFYASDNVKIYNNNIFEYFSDEKYDAIVMFWGVICDFNNEEQFLLLKKLKSLMSEDGVIIFDMLDHISPSNLLSHKNDNIFFIEEEYGTIVNRFPTKNEILKYSISLSLSLSSFRYTTSTKRKRIFYILSN